MSQVDDESRDETIERVRASRALDECGAGGRADVLEVVETGARVSHCEVEIPVGIKIAERG